MADELDTLEAQMVAAEDALRAAKDEAANMPATDRREFLSPYKATCRVARVAYRSHATALGQRTGMVTITEED